MRQLFGHYLGIEVRARLRLVPAVVDVEHVVVLAENLVEFADELTHEHLGPEDEEDWFLVGCGVFVTMLVLILKAILYIRIKRELNIMSPLKALVKRFVRNLPIQDRFCVLKLTLYGFKFVAADPLECLQVRKVNVLPLELAETINIAGLKVAVEDAGLHLKFLSEGLIADGEYLVVGFVSDKTH